MSTFTEKNAKLKELSLGNEIERVVVLGAFDTWVFMHRVAIYLAQNNYTALTSRYIYYPNPDSVQKYSRWPNYPKDEKQTMKEFLKEELIEPCSKAIIIFSVPAAHYNEVEWCADKNKDTLGIAFVRSIKVNDMCSDCIIDIEHDYAFCVGEDTAWKCISKPDCPFKKQEIAKNQLEYFSKKENMNLVAIEKSEKLNDVMNLFLKGDLVKPLSRPFVYEFRVELNKEDFNTFITKFINIMKKYEEQEDRNYEFIDYYFKPVNLSIEEWFNKNRTFRLREWNHPIKPELEYIHSDIDILDKGFITLNEHGYKKLFKADIDNENPRNFGEGLNLHEFLRIEKEDGYKFDIKTPFPHTVYIEKIRAQNRESTINCYSMEIEFWISNYKDKEYINEKQNTIIKEYKLQDKKTYKYPLQKIICDKFKM